MTTHSRVTKEMSDQVNNNYNIDGRESQQPSTFPVCMNQQIVYPMINNSWLNNETIKVDFCVQRMLTSKTKKPCDTSTVGGSPIRKPVCAYSIPADTPKIFHPVECDGNFSCREFVRNFSRQASDGNFFMRRV